MHKRLFIWLIVAAFTAPLVAQVGNDPRVILISIDGLMPSSYTSPTSPRDHAATARGRRESGRRG